MLRVEKSQMIVVEGANGIDLQNKYNDAMNGLIRIGVTIDDKVISIEKMSAIILYHEIERIPQNLKDEYELKGLYPTCDSCPHYMDLGGGNGDCPFIRVHRGGCLRHDDAICEKRWRELEEGRFKSVSVFGKGDERKACNEDSAC